MHTYEKDDVKQSQKAKRRLANGDCVAFALNVRGKKDQLNIFEIKLDSAPEITREQAQASNMMRSSKVCFLESE